MQWRLFQSFFILLLAIFLLTSHTNSFFSLSPVAGDQVRVNHVIWFEESMSKQKNKTNLQINQTHGLNSYPKQDAELPSKIIDSTDTQSLGLCQDKWNQSKLCFVTNSRMMRSRLGFAIHQILKYPVGKGQNNKVLQCLPAFPSLLSILIWVEDWLVVGLVLTCSKNSSNFINQQSFTECICLWNVGVHLPAALTLSCRHPKVTIFDWVICRNSWILYCDGKIARIVHRAPLLQPWYSR